MKKYLILLILFSTLKVLPQKLTQEPVPYNTNNIKLLKCQRMQRNGIILMCAGGVATGVGVGLFVDALNHDLSKTNGSPAPNSSNYLPRMYAGTILSAIGLLTIAQGTISYLVGKKRERKYSKNLTLFIAPTSLLITYKF